MWRVRLCETMTGYIFNTPDITTQLSWSDDTLNQKDGTLNFKVPYTVLDSMSRNQWALDDASALLEHRNSEEDVWDLITFGPLQQYQSDDGHYVDIQADTGPRGILAARYLNAEWSQFPSPQSWIANRWDPSNTSYGEIMWEIIQNCMNKPNGALPIWKGPGISQTGTRQDTFHTYNLANQSCDKLLTDKTNLDSGPDIRFVPMLSTDAEHVAWRFECGAEGSAGITSYTQPPQKPVTFTLESAKTDLPSSGMTMTATSSGKAQRLYGIGAGQNEGTLVRVHEEFNLLSAKTILKEGVVSNSETNDPNYLLNVLIGDMPSHRYNSHSIKLQVRADSSENSINDYMPGTIIQVGIYGRRIIPDGVYNACVLQRSGDNSENISLTVDLGVTNFN